MTDFVAATSDPEQNPSKELQNVVYLIFGRTVTPSSVATSFVAVDELDREP